MENVETGYRGPRVCKLVGITYRQLDYWARTELVTPSVRDADGSGSQREYSFGDLVHLKLIKQLLETGISLQKVRKAIDYVRNDMKVPLETVLALASDGTTVYAATSANEVIDLLNAGQGVFAIAVGKVYEELQGSIAEFKKPDAGDKSADEDPEASSG
jgi:DNA-binding transcriptional MerR regulator